MLHMLVSRHVHLPIFEEGRQTGREGESVLGHFAVKSAALGASGFRVEGLQGFELP